MLLSRAALGYNLVKYFMCKYPVGAVMWYTMYKNIDFIGVSVYNSDNKEHTSVYLSPPVWFDGLFTEAASSLWSLPLSDICDARMKNAEFNMLAPLL